MSRGQSLLFDLLIAFGLFSIGLLIILVFIGDSFGLFGVDRLDRDADLIVRSLSEPESGFADHIFDSRGVLSESSFFDLLNKPYDSLKSDLNVFSDFCIYVVDSEGNLVSVSNPLNSGDVDSSVGYSSIDGLSRCG